MYPDIPTKITVKYRDARGEHLSVSVEDELLAKAFGENEVVVFVRNMLTQDEAQKLARRLLALKTGVCFVKE